MKSCIFFFAFLAALAAIVHAAPLPNTITEIQVKRTPMVDKREKKQDDNHPESEDAACYTNCAGGRENKPAFHTCTAVQHCPQ